ncbi:MAG: carboxylating nicotinate-nucleotide diphosphorylase [Pseudomonadota bacterium]
MTINPFFLGLQQTVATAIAEDVGSGDITAALVSENSQARARVMTREHAVVCGEPWVNEVFFQIDPLCKVEWIFHDGDHVKPNDIIFNVEGPARSLLTAERTALNFLQTLSGVATVASHYAELVKHTVVQILDTRKTIPGLRLAQKYAVKTGGSYNHRIGLFDAYLIKENHIRACGGIAQAINTARRLNPGRKVEVEVETMTQLDEALEAKADIVMLDNFTLDMIRAAVVVTNGRTKLEASGGYSEESLVAAAETGVDFISVGGLTKHVRATDYTMLFTI